MTRPRAETTFAGPVGSLLRRWRGLRRMSQLELALAAGVSPRHLSFVETGRARPGRAVLLSLAAVLELPFRDRNAMLAAAGFAPAYRETGLSEPEMEQARRALERILAQQEPYPATVVDRRWNIVMTNRATDRWFGLLLPPDALADLADGGLNALKMMFDPALLRPFVIDWPDTARTLLARAHREALHGDDEAEALVEELRAMPGVPSDWRRDIGDGATPPVLAIGFRAGALSVSWFTTMTTFGTPQNVTLQELRIECLFPADAATERAARDLAAGRSPG